MKICMDCGVEFADGANYCAICGEPVVAVVAPATADAASSRGWGIIGKVLAAPALLLGLFVAVCLAITYYAGVVALTLSFGMPIISGIVTATVLLIGIAAAWYLIRAKRSGTAG